MVEVNEVLYPNQFDSNLNWPATTEVTEATGEDINRNRDGIINIERVLGLNPHIGRYTVDSVTATVAQRLNDIENGIAEARFAFRNLNVNNALVVTTDMSGVSRVDIGGSPINPSIAPVYVRGPLRILDSGVSRNEVQSEVPFIINNKGTIIQSSAIVGVPLLRITDLTANPRYSDKFALEIDGNVIIRQGKLYAEYAIEHNTLLGINTIPREGANAVHVTRGDHHSHCRKRDAATGALLNEVDPNPTENSRGLINHMDLLDIYTKTGQTDFIPVKGVAYHVTNGDDHDHRDGRGAPIDHSQLLNTDPALSAHVTNGDAHTHSPSGDGAPVDHNHLTNIGFLSHADIDRILNIELRNHLDLIDPDSPSQIVPAKQGLSFHVPQGHVSNPSAHHARYTDQEALSAQVQIASNTTVYQEGRNTTPQSHIQAIGSGTVAANNPHGLSASDIGALEGFDPQGNLPGFTKQFLERAVVDILNDPTFGVPRNNEAESITGLWTFENAGGIIIKRTPALGDPSFALTYDDIVRLPDLIDHIDNTGTPPYHMAEDIVNVPTPYGTIVATNVQEAIDELDADVQSKEDQLSASNQVEHIELADNAVESNNIKDGEVTLVKLANQYSICSYNFNTIASGAVLKFGFKIPTIAGGIDGTVIGVSATWQQVSGTSSQATVEINNGINDIVTSVNIMSLTADSVPVDLTLDQESVGTGDDIVVSIGEVGGSNINVSVTIHVKYKHT